MSRISDYRDVLEFLLEFTDYEKVTKYKYDLATFNLGRVEDLMAAVGSPHRAFPSVHVAGTKGKGSTATMIQCILTAAGLKTGLYTSPHLCRLEERMTINGSLMPEAELVEIVNRLVPYTLRARRERPNESPTYFELVTTVGFLHFARQKTDCAVVEVGLGGRLDATNVITPEVSVITRIDFDHVERLGDTLAKIAAEKAGIVKDGVPVVCAEQEPEALGVIAAAARRKNAPLTLIGRDYSLKNVDTGTGVDGAFTRFDLAAPNQEYKGLTLGLLGLHQAQNAAAAVAAVDVYAARKDVAISEDAVRKGLASARLPARLECFAGAPTLLLDGAHNLVSIRGLRGTLERVFADRRKIFLLGFSRDKDIEGMLKTLLPLASSVVLTRSDSPRAADPEEVAALARELGATRVETVQPAAAALDRARELAEPADLLCITGSFFLAGNLRPLLVG